MKVKLKKFRENASLPEKATKLAGGWDVTAAHIQRTTEKGVVICYLGWGMEIPPGYRLRLIPRSSFTKHKWLMQNSPGMGDADFPGEYRFVFRALEETWVGPVGTSVSVPQFPYEIGDRIGQVYLEPVIQWEPQWVNEFSERLENSERSGDGFGSTGNK